MEKEREIWETLKKMLAKTKKTLYISVSASKKFNFLEEVVKLCRNMK